MFLSIFLGGGSQPSKRTLQTPGYSSWFKQEIQVCSWHLKMDMLILNTHIIFTMKAFIRATIKSSGNIVNQLIMVILILC